MQYDRVKVTVTEFRKDLFHLMDRAVNGELVEVVHKGCTIRLHPQAFQSKMSRLVRRDTLLCSPDELDNIRKELQNEMSAEMDKDWTDT